MSAPKKKQNIIVIGGGIIGCTAAYYLTHHPQFDPSIHTVTVIEASKIASGASGKAGGLLAAWAYPNNLAKLSFDLHDQLAQEHNGTELWGYRRARCGQITAVAPQEAYQQKSSNQPSIELGKYWARGPRNSSVLPEDLDWFDPKSAKAYEELADENSTAQVYPLQFTNSMIRLATERGAKLIVGRVEHINCCNADDKLEKPSPLDPSDNLSQKKVLSVTYLDKATSERHVLPATTILLAAGPWTPTLLPQVRMQPLRAHSVTIKLKREVSAYCLFSDIHLSVSRSAAGAARPMSLEIYARPNNEVYICGQGDLNIALPPPGNAVEISSNSCQDIINAASSVSDDIRSGQVMGRRACYLPVVDIGASNDPLIGQTELAGLVLATGHSCWGISNATGTGKIREGYASNRRRSNIPQPGEPPNGGLSLTRGSISDADYDRLYSEIFGDIVRRLNLGRESASVPQEDPLLEARPGNASLPSFNREVFSIVGEHVSRDGPSSSLQSDTIPIRDHALERGPDHVRKLLRDSLPSHDVSLQLLNLFLDFQNSIFYVCSREDVTAQLALMYEQPGSVSISWYCQMFLILAVGIQFDDIYDADGASYYETGKKYIDDALDENPHSTIWVIRAMLLLCFYQPQTKWNSVWMQLDAAIRGAQRFQLDTGQNDLKELSDSEYQEWRQIWFTVISFDRWVAIFLGRLPRIKESISRDPIFKDSHFKPEDTLQNSVTRLAIISGNILRDMYFADQPSINICRQRKGDLEQWMSALPDGLQQFVQSGNVPEFPRDQAEAIFNLHFMHLGAWILVTRPYLLKALKMKASSTFGGSIASVISSEANL
ncbi:oxidoreductase [Hyphodiscus hymeniophilus]|uniref:Oxidoreductase n=1 Tax=Hyphodiscus hymeniophilus TaxID=353542 RepID=A0A9P7AU01_9HELO|nr:oxidoreductase [Hyphodiscus hymeniophilus]